MESALYWEMTSKEAEVYGLAVLYTKELKRVFGQKIDYGVLRQNSLPKRGDPRKSSLFRYCWKMRRETLGLLDLEDYKNYIYANLLIVRLNNGKVLPTCVCGDKAWIRYKVWKRKYDLRESEKVAVILVSNANPKILAEIDRTKKFLFEKCEGEVTLGKVQKFIEMGIFRFWVASGKVSPYYVVQSPFVAKTCKPETLLGSSSFGAVSEKLTEDIRRYFKLEYKHEYP